MKDWSLLEKITRRMTEMSCRIENRPQGDVRIVNLRLAIDLDTFVVMWNKTFLK